eukprot:1161319-Pelagomonas_calceolata.AAC.5
MGACGSEESKSKVGVTKLHLPTRTGAQPNKGACTGAFRSKEQEGKHRVIKLCLPQTRQLDCSGVRRHICGNSFAEAKEREQALMGVRRGKGR